MCVCKGGCVGGWLCLRHLGNETVDDSVSLINNDVVVHFDTRVF